MQRIPMDGSPGNPTPASPVAKVVGRIEINRDARLAAEAIADLCTTEAHAYGLRFWQALDSLIARYLPTPCRIRQEEAMTDEEASCFGRERMPFGEFAGFLVNDVPLNRLEWYSDQRFNEQIRRYLKSPKISHERSRDDE